MLTEAQERWLAALESGDYKQGKRLLHSIRKDGEYFCCLGVACHLFQEELGLNHRVDVDSVVVKYNDEDGYLPLVVQEHLMLRSELGQPITGESLTYLNDGDCKTFKQIAAIIRANPSAYFKEIDNHVD